MMIIPKIYTCTQPH